MPHPTLIVITGPTASGKSALAIEVARRLDTEIVNADSRQVYRDIPIATASPTAEELAQAPHRLFGFLPLEKGYSAAAYAEDARKALDEIFSYRDVAVLCGGSQMYIDAVCGKLDNLPDIPQAVRERILSELATYGLTYLQERLRELDAEGYEQIDIRNPRRVCHALELCIASEMPYSELLKKGKDKPKPPFRIIKYALTAPRPVLFERINSRVLRMMDSGLMDEALRTYSMRHLNSLNTVGLKEMYAVIEEKMSLSEAISRLQKNTRVYAKKQLTWLKRDTNTQWLDITSGDNLAERISTSATRE